jgi:hypothetical protein
MKIEVLRQLSISTNEVQLVAKTRGNHLAHQLLFRHHALALELVGLDIAAFNWLFTNSNAT